MSQDGFAAAVSLLRAHSVELLGSLEVIAQQAPLFDAKYDVGNIKREQLIKLMTDLANKTSKLSSQADKVMSIIFVGGEDETPSDLSENGQDNESNTDSK